MHKLVSFCMLFSGLAFAAKSAVTLECKPGVKRSSSTKTEEIPDYASKLSRFEDVDSTTLTLTRDSATLEVDSKELDGDAVGNLPTEKFHFDKLGKNIDLVLASAGAYLGSQTTGFKLYAHGPDSATFTWDFKCKNTRPGKVASFIKLCTEEPTLKKKIKCTAQDEQKSEGAGMPDEFTLTSTDSGTEISYEGDDKETVTSELKFRPNKAPAGNSPVIYLEYCYFSPSGKASMDQVKLSRALSEKGKGLATLPVKEEDGAAAPFYDCK